MEINSILPIHFVYKNTGTEKHFPYYSSQVLRLGKKSTTKNRKHQNGNIYLLKFSTSYIWAQKKLYFVGILSLPMGTWNVCVKFASTQFFFLNFVAICVQLIVYFNKTKINNLFRWKRFNGNFCNFFFV